jgi:outer membrane protein assembly factor BamB
MTADALRLRRARRAIYGPPTLALVGVALVAAGVFGLATYDGASGTSTTALLPPVTVRAAQNFVLVDARGRLYPGGVANRPNAVHAVVPKDATVVGATVSPDGGHWLVTRDGRVIGVGTRALGQHKIRPRSSPIVGIAASPTGGYWIARADGHVYAFDARHHGDLSSSRHARVVDIAATPDGGYWLVMSDGKVKGFATSGMGSSVRRARPQIVGVAASRDGGYWLASADGHVYPFAGASPHGDAAHSKLPAPVADIAPSPNGGYWLATTDGHVYAFGTPDDVPQSPPVKGRIVAILPA